MSMQANNNRPICCLLLFIISVISSFGTTLSCITNNINTITVSQQGHGNFNKVQDAINSIPSGNNQWIRIYVNPGIYWEQVRIPYDKQCILLEGTSPTNTKIVFDAHTQTDASATFISGADNFVAKNIGFMNAYNNPGSGTVPRGIVKQAVAASVYGDKSSFYNCAFVGYQDTIWDVSGRHYYQSCYIEGAIDFIWGNGQSFFENCKINVVGDGFITAQVRESGIEKSGFVFNGGIVYGNGQAYLGRALAAYSRVIFQYTHFSNVIHPLGWDSRDRAGYEFTFTYLLFTLDIHVTLCYLLWVQFDRGQLTFAEVKCNGEGANMIGRVPWEKSINQQSELDKYTRHAFVDEDNWISQQPR